MENNANLPSQKLLRGAKDKNWGQLTIDGYEKLVYSNVQYNRPYRYQKQVNYDLFNGKFNPKDLEYVTKPYGVANEFPAVLNHYDILSPKLMLLIGEEIKRPFNFKVYAENPEAVSQIEEQKEKMLMDYLQQKLVSGKSDEEMGNSPEQINKYVSYSFQDVYSKAGQESLNILQQDLRLELLFNKGWKDALICAEEIYWTGIINGEPIARICNPLDISVVLDPDSDFIDEAQAIIEERWLTLGTVLDEFFDVLSDEEVNRLQTSAFRNDAMGGIANNLTTQSFTIMPLNGDQPGNSYTRPYRDINGNIRVVRVEWKSMRKIGTLTFLDENGESQETLVDETYKADKEAGEKVEWFWINEYWEGTKIAKDIYVNVQPKQNQRRRMDNPSRCKSGYCGVIYNNRNSQGISLIDRMKPFQYLYNIIYYRLELALAKYKGKVMLMDIAQIPTSEDWDVDKWMYYLDSMGVAFINSFEEGKQGASKGQRSNFNTFQSIDLTTGTEIQQCVSLLEKIKGEIGDICGVTNQRLGQIQTSELVGNTERATVQSSHITEYWFYYHNEVKRRVLTSLLDAAKIAWRKGKKIQYILDDMSRALFEIEGSEFECAEYGVYMSNSSKDDRILEGLKQLAQAALQTDKATLSEIITIMESNSITDIKKKLEKGENDKFERDSKQQQAQIKQQQDAINAEMKDKEEQRIFEGEQKQLDRDNKIDIAEIGALSFAKDTDIDNNGIPDVLEIERLKLDKQELQHKNNETIKKLGLEKEKINMESQDGDKQRAHEKELAKAELIHKKNELLQKEKIEKLKLRAARAKANKPK